MKRDRSIDILLGSLGVIILAAATVAAFVPLIEPPPPPWPVFCETGETHEKITLLEWGRRKLPRLPWLKSERD